MTIDCYGCEEHQLDDIKVVNKILTEVVYQVGLNPICPPYIIPYYYGKVREDLGISAIVLLEGGHLTIHTFPIRECYFVDCFSTDDFNELAIENFFSRNLVYNKELSTIHTTNRRQNDYEVLPYDPQCDFGPHLMTEIKASEEINMNNMFDFLEAMVDEINMDPISRAYVVKSSYLDPKYLSGIIVIAQSHISLHYEYATGIIYADIFSCTPFDYSVVEGYLSKLGTIERNILIPRGTKHIYRVRSNVTNDELMASTKWQKISRKR